MGLDKTEVTEMAGKTATMIRAEQPDVAEVITERAAQSPQEA